MEQVKESLEVSVKCQLRDVLRYNMSIAYRSIVSKVMLGVAAALLAYLGHRYTVRTASLDVFIAQNIILIILPLFIVIATPWKVWKITVMQMQSSVFAEAAIYTFYKDKLHIKTSTLEDDVPWETYIKIVETAKDFRFFVDRVQAQIIPKHTMTAEQIEKLKEFIREANPESIYHLKTK